MLGGVAPLLCSLGLPTREANAAPSRAGEGDRKSRRAGAPPNDPSRDPGCIYGRVVDGHSGEVRCLSPEEAKPPGPYDLPRPGPIEDAGADADAADAFDSLRREAGLDASPGAIPLGSLSATIEDVTFENGEIPQAPKNLDRI